MYRVASWIKYVPINSLRFNQRCSPKVKHLYHMRRHIRQQKMKPTKKKNSQRNGSDMVYAMYFIQKWLEKNLIIRIVSGKGRVECYIHAYLPIYPGNIPSRMIIANANKFDSILNPMIVLLFFLIVQQTLTPLHNCILCIILVGQTKVRGLYDEISCSFNDVNRKGGGRDLKSCLITQSIMPFKAFARY